MNLFLIIALLLYNCLLYLQYSFGIAFHFLLKHFNLLLFLRILIQLLFIIYLHNMMQFYLQLLELLLLRFVNFYVNLVNIIKFIMIIRFMSSLKMIMILQFFILSQYNFQIIFSISERIIIFFLQLIRIMLQNFIRSVLVTLD